MPFHELLGMLTAGPQRTNVNTTMKQTRSAHALLLISLLCTTPALLFIFTLHLYFITRLIPIHTSIPISPPRLLLTISSNSNSPVFIVYCITSMNRDIIGGINTTYHFGSSLSRIAPTGTKRQTV